MKKKREGDPQTSIFPISREVARVVLTETEIDRQARELYEGQNQIYNLYAPFLHGQRQSCGNILAKSTYLDGALWFTDAVFEEARLRAIQRPILDSNILGYYMINVPLDDEAQREKIARVVLREPAAQGIFVDTSEEGEVDEEFQSAKKITSWAVSFDLNDRSRAFSNTESEFYEAVRGDVLTDTSDGATVTGFNSMMTGASDIRTLFEVNEKFNRALTESGELPTQTGT